MKLIFIVISCLSIVPGVCGGDTIIVKSDGTGDYPTIQSALNAAKAGDEVVLEPGTYSGEGNYNLDFNGKAITVRSRYPEQSDCRENTIIDAQGQGVIARFIHDEKPDTVFEGFTLGAGDTKQPVRGAAGLFEFSINARPTTRYLQQKPNSFAVVSSEPQADYTFICPGIDNPPPGRIWDGLNPYHQPVRTTLYYGSGDVNADGQLTSADVQLAQEIINGQHPNNIMTDINGDGLITATDVTLLTSAVNSGAILPAWWDQLTTRDQRNNWITIFMARDKTDQHVYDSQFFVCHDFAYQTYVHGAFERDDFATESTEYDGGQTVYNLPVYHTLVSTPTGHAINAILVGDDPTQFNDWRFVEPQNDLDVVPGQWNMLYGSTVTIGNRYNSQDDMVGFYVDAAGTSLTYVNPAFTLTRPTPGVQQADNRKDLWHPVIVPHAGAGLLFFEKMREDLSRTTDIFMIDINSSDLEQAVSVTNRFHFSRFLDATQGPDGSIHLLFESKSTTDKQNIFHGIYDPVNRKLTDVSQVTEGLRLAAMGRIEVTATNEIFVFWFENYGYSGTYEMGVHWTKSSGSGWQTPQLLTPTVRQQQTGNWVNRQFAWYIFDTEVLTDGRVMLICNEWASGWILSQYIYDGAWVNTKIEGPLLRPLLQGVDLCQSRDGVIHLGYWRAQDDPDLCYLEGETPEEGRGAVYHRMFNGTSWTSATVLDTTWQASAVHLAAGPNNLVCMIWERRIGDSVAAVWNSRRNGSWGTPEVLYPASGFDVWYPTISVQQDGQIFAAWSARNNDLVTIETIPLEGPTGDVLPISFIGDLDGDMRVDLKDFTRVAAAWKSHSEDLHWMPLADIGLPLDDQVDLNDLVMFCAHWLSEPLPEPEYFEEDFETGNFSRYPWQQAGNAPWIIDASQPAQGLYSAKSSVITHSQKSTLTIDQDFAGSRITFYRKVSSEANFDYLRFYIDGVKKKEWSGTVSWGEESFTISPGHHIFSWSYEKDNSISTGSDRVWVDSIKTLP